MMRRARCERYRRLKNRNLAKKKKKNPMRKQNIAEFYENLYLLNAQYESIKEIYCIERDGE